MTQNIIAIIFDFDITLSPQFQHISKIITDIVEGGRIKLTRLEEMLATPDPKMKKALIDMRGENK